MAKLTRGKVCYNLEVTPYTYQVEYESGIITYHFSSNFYLNNFVDKLASNREYYNRSLSKRFNIPMVMNNLADVILYSKIEKRGFCLKVNEEFIRCQESIKFVGSQVMSNF